MRLSQHTLADPSSNSIAAGQDAARKKHAHLPPSFIELGIENNIDVKAMPRVLGRLTKLALRYPWHCFLAVASALGAAVFNLVTPRLLGQAVDQAYHVLDTVQVSGGASHTLLITALLIVASCAVRGTLTGLQGYLGENIAQRVGHDLRVAFFDKLQRLSFSYHDGVHSGDLIARGMLDLEGVRGFLEAGLLRVITLAMLLGVGAWRLLSVDVTLGLLALSFVPFVIWRAARMGFLLRLSWQRLQQLMSDMTLGMEENLQGVRVVRAFASQAYELAKFDRVSALTLRLSNLRITVRMGAMSLMNLSHYVSMGLVLYVGGERIAAGTMTVGTLTEFLTFITILNLPVRQVGMVVNSSARATGAGGRLFEVLDAEPAVRNAPDALPLNIENEMEEGTEHGLVRFEHVDFRYPGSNRNALIDINLELRPGEILGIVGPPGSGKSTLVHLIPRFYDVSAGRITIDGRDIRGLTLESLRDHVALVQQETFLFDTTVHNNVAYAEPWTEEENVVDAATTAQIHEHVAQLAQGYDTRVGERGVALSGGQRQRMSIARALVADPAILVLDDSTAAVDAATEQLVRAELQRAVRDKATIIIAHRLSSLMHADEIVVLDQGRIVERGTHAQLVSAGGEYAALWALQNRSADDAHHAGRNEEVTA